MAIGLQEKLFIPAFHAKIDSNAELGKRALLCQTRIGTS